MDRFEQLAATAQILSSIFGCTRTNDFWVVEMPTEECISTGLAAQGYRFCGYLGVVDGETCSAVSVEVSFDALAGIRETFNRQVTRVLRDRLAKAESASAGVEILNPKPADDFVTFAEILWKLEDPR